MRNIVLAYDERFGSGADNDLLWQRHLANDLRHFRELTLGQAVIMGRKTYESIGRPLPGRQNIVVTRGGMAADGIDVVHSLDEAYDAVEPDREPFVIGGGEVYRLAYPTIDRIYATLVHAAFENASVFFPALSPDEWHETSREDHQADEKNKYGYSFITYARNDS